MGEAELREKYLKKAAIGNLHIQEETAFEFL